MVIAPPRVHSFTQDGPRGHCRYPAKGVPANTAPRISTAWLLCNHGPKYLAPARCSQLSPSGRTPRVRAHTSRPTARTCSLPRERSGSATCLSGKHWGPHQRTNGPGPAPSSGVGPVAPRVSVGKYSGPALADQRPQTCSLRDGSGDATCLGGVWIHTNGPSAPDQHLAQGKVRRRHVSQ